MADSDITTPLLGGGGGGNKPARTPQYFTAFSATLGSLAIGTVLGYSSPAGPQLIDETFDDFLHLTESQNSWFSSLMNVGAMMGGLVAGLCLSKLGRRSTLLAVVLPFIAGWLLIVFAQNFAMLLVGRIVTGLCSGIMCMAIPTYIAEFASADIRGTLGSSFHMMMVIGIVYSYAFGAVVPSWRWLAVVCIIPLIVYFILMFFAKESPSFLLFQGEKERAAAALQHFRGKDRHIQTELDMMHLAIEEYRHNKASFSDFKKPYILKPIFISFSLMAFQQLSGVNGVLFNLSIIFSSSGSQISDDLSSIIVGLMEVAGTLLAITLMDKAGRKLLLIASSSIMALSLVGLGEFFYMKNENAEWAAKLGWLPLLFLMMFMTAFCIGYGPIPWVMMGELFSPDVRELAASQATMLNWTMSFLVTFIFTPLRMSIGDAGMYWFFGGICVVNLMFCVTVVPETKGKTLEEITASFRGPAFIAMAERRNSSDC